MSIIGGVGDENPYASVSTKNPDGTPRSQVEVVQDLNQIADAKANERSVAQMMMADGNTDRNTKSAMENANMIASAKRDADRTSAIGKVAAIEVGAASQTVQHMASST